MNVKEMVLFAMIVCITFRIHAKGEKQCNGQTKLFQLKSVALNKGQCQQKSKEFYQPI